MAGTIGRLFVEIGGDTSKLTESLRQATANLQAVNPQFEKLTSAGKSLLNSFEAAINPSKRLGEELRFLSDAGKSNADIMTVMKDRITQVGDATTRQGQAIDPTVKKFYDMATAGEKSSFSIEGLGKTLTDFANNPVGAAKSAITGFLESLGPVAVGVGAIGAAAVAAGGALVKFVADAADQQEQFQNLAAMTGLSVTQLQALKQIAKEAGLESLDLGRTIGKLNEQLGDPKANEFTDAMKLMGLSTMDVSGKTKDAITVLDEMRGVLLAIKDPTERAQVAQQALGGRLRELIPLLVNSDASLSDMMKTMEQMGVTTDELTQQKLTEFDRIMDELDRVWVSEKTSLTELATAFVMLAREVVTSSEGMKLWSAQMATIIGGPTGLKILKAIMGESKNEIKETNAAVNTGAAMWAKWDAELKAGTGSAKGMKEKLDALADANERDLKAVKEAQKEYEAHAKKVEALGKQYTSTGGSIESATDILEKFWLAARQKSTAEIVLGDLDRLTEKSDALRESIEKLPVRWKLPQPEPGDADKLLAPINAAPEKAAKLGKECSNAFLNQVSTIGTDLSKKIVDGLMAGKLSIVDTIKDIGGSLLRALLESFINPFLDAFVKGFRTLLSGGGFSGLGWGDLTGGILGSFTGGKKGAGLATAGGGLLGAFGIGGGGGAAAGGIVFDEALGGFVTTTPGAGAAGGGIMGSLGSFFTNPWTIGIGASIAAGLLGYKFAKGPTSYEAGGEEVVRDLGITGIGKQQVEDFFNAMGMSESSAWDIRKDLLSSPQFLVNVAGPIAQATGQFDKFLTSLQKVTTSWGSFNFRDAFEVGTLTGDWSALDKAFVAAFGSSSRLRDLMPDFASKLTITGDAAADAATSTNTMSESFARATTTARNASTSILTVVSASDRTAISARDAAGAMDATAQGFDRAATAAGRASASIEAIGDSVVRATSTLRDYGDAVASVMMGNAFGISFYTTPPRWGVTGDTTGTGGNNPYAGTTVPYVPFTSTGGISDRGVVTDIPFNASTGTGGGRTGVLGSYASGTDYVPRTGIYQLEMGEGVTPANRNRPALNLTVNLNGTVMGNDVERLVAQAVTRLYQRGGFDYLR